MTGNDDEKLIFSGEICASFGDISDRCLRKWIEVGRFPRPDGNLNGRNFWFGGTVRQHRAEVLAGKYSQQRRPVAVASGSQKDAA